MVENINISYSLTYLTVSPTKLVKYRNGRLFNMAYGVGAVDGVDGACGCGPNFLPGIAVVVVIILLLIAMGIVF
jgi:hypothetical protein